VINLNAVANEVFQILRSFDYTVMMYDDAGMQVYEPEEARRMFAKPENLLVSIIEDNDDSRINLYLSGDTDAEAVLGLITSLRTAANKYNMIFDDQKWDRDLTVKDFASKNSVTETKQMDLTEGMYGTSRSSYLKLENARMIVRHSAKIDENIAGARSRRVESIFCENERGERFLFPTKQLAPARAMTQHLNHGGQFADEVGQQITQMAQDYSALGQASSFIGMNQPVLAEGAMELREKCRESRKGLRKCFERLYRESTYTDQASILGERAANPVLAEDAAVERLREMLNVEGAELDESVITSIARCVETATPVLDEAEVSGEAPEDAEPAPVGDTVHVLGHRVDRAAWQTFKDGKLTLRASPESLMGSGPEFRDRAAATMFRFENLIPMIVSKGDKEERAVGDTLVNLFSTLVGEYDNADRKKKEGILTIAKFALEFAKVPVSEGLGFRGSKVIREFEEWLDEMTPDHVLGRMDEPMGADLGDIGADLAPEMPGEMDMGAEMGADMGMGADLGDELPGEVVAGPDASMGPLSGSMGMDDASMEMPPMDAGMESEGDDEGIAADIANGYTEGSNWHLDFPQRETAYEVVGEKTSLIQISNAVLGGSRKGSVHSDPIEGARQSFEWSVESTIAVTQAPMTAPMDAPMDAPMVPAMDMGAMDPMGLGEGELTREDILLPRDQEDDLKQEVGHDVESKDDFERGDDVMAVERLRKLSGIRID
jgi:hypothetical protein